MNESRRMAVLATLVDGLRERGSWCGETHVQKATYFLQELLGVPFEHEFILYKHGPFSFELRDELTGMRADEILALESRPYPYGPSLVSTDLAKSLEGQFPKTVAKYQPAVDFVADELGDMGAVELERVSTALLVTQESEASASTEDRARLLVDLKPHVPLEKALKAVARVDSIIADAQSKGLA